MAAIRSVGAICTILPADDADAPLNVNVRLFATLL
jgi:hypothetical protein